MTLDRFLIIGAHRSGTSLLTRILNQHSTLAVPPESFFFNTFVPLRKFYGDLERDENFARLIDDVLSTPKVAGWSPTPTREQILERVSERSMGSVFLALLDTWAESQGKTYWGEKTPHHVFYWPEISEALPDVPLVHIVRDGRDVALGLVKARFGPKSVYTAGRRWARWMDAIEEIRARVPSGRLYQISYEGLLTEPERTVGGICEFLGVPFEKAMLDFHEDRSPYSGYAAEHANLNKPLLADKVGAWHQTMKRSDVTLFESIASEQLRRYGYPVEGVPAEPASWKRAYYKWLHHPPRKAVALLRNRPGQREEFQLFKLRVRLLVRYWLSGGRPASSPR